MPAEVPPPTQVLTLVFLAWGTGTVVVGAWTRTWDEIQPGHFKVIWLVSTGLFAAAGFGYRPAWIVAGVCLATFFAVYRGLDFPSGVGATAAAILALVLRGPLFALAPAALLGTATNAMLLGHWHLNQPRLGTGPIARVVWTTWISLGAYAVVSGVLVASALSEDAGVRFAGAGTAVAFTLFAAILTALVHHLVRTRSIMSATGILYLEILLCFVAAFTGSIAALA